MRRREFITRLGGAAVAAPVLWPFSTRAQQAMPVIGFLHSGSPEPNAVRIAGFRKGLGAAGVVEGENVRIEFRWALGRNDRLPDMAADLIRRRVAVITTPASVPAALAAKAATTDIPIVFAVASDPVALGLVASLNRPGGNITGIATLNAELAAKRLGLLRDLLPQAARFTVLVNSNNALADAFVKDLQVGASPLGINPEIVNASTEPELDAAFANVAKKPGGVLIVGTDSYFYIRRGQIAALAARYALPTIYDNRDYAEAGGLVSYGPDVVSAFEQAGGYTGRILKGEKPANLPVAQSTKFETVINLKAAKALGLEIPAKLLFTADEVIE
jgi:putative ABC transport system substrate-binding protein